MLRAAIFVVLLSLVPLSASFGLCDILNVIKEWGPCTQPCLYDWSQDGKVDLFDIVFVINGWTGSAGCEMTAAPFIDGWTVETEPQSAPLCPGNDVTLRTTISFTNLAPLENFIVQADAPFEGATIQSVTLVATGQSSWSSSNCVIYTSAGYSYFTCENGGDIKDGDTFVLSYILRSLGTRVGFFTSEVTTFPPVQIAQGVILDMFCGSTVPTTTATPTTTPAPPFVWSHSITGPAQICDALTSTYTVTVDVASGFGFPFLVGSSFIRGEGLEFLNPRAYWNGTVFNSFSCTLFSSSSFACDGVADRSFTVEFGLKRTGTPPTGSLDLSVVTGFTNSNLRDQIKVIDLSYDPLCSK